MQIVSLSRCRLVPFLVGAVLWGGAAHAAGTTLLVNPVPNAAESRFTPTTWVEHAVEQLRGEAISWLGRALTHPTPRVTDNALNAAAEMLHRTGTTLTGPQLVLVVDRAPSVQRLWLALDDQTTRPWQVIAAVKVSTGKPGRKEHFRTPVGVFTNTPAIFGYRAEGTLNENGIRGNGIKGMRVWDFGWQTTDDWRTPGALTSIRLEMHATDPTFLESRLGRADSEGCIRVPAVFDRFLDHFGLLDAELTPLVSSDRAIAALLPHDATPFPFAGSTVIVVDTSDPGAAPSDPVEAQAIQTRFADWLASTAHDSPAAAGPVRPASNSPPNVIKTGSQVSVPGS